MYIYKCNYHTVRPNVDCLRVLDLLGAGEVAPDGEHAGVADEEEVDDHRGQSHHRQPHRSHPANIIWKSVTIHSVALSIYNVCGYAVPRKVCFITC